MKTIKFLEENAGANADNLKLDNAQKLQMIKEKMGKLGFINIKDH